MSDKQIKRQNSEFVAGNEDDEGGSGRIDLGIPDINLTYQDLFNRPLSQEEFYYLLSLYPYITVCDHNNAFIGPDEIPKRLKTENGWNMFVYESAVCLGTNYLAAERFQIENDVKGLGTLSKQGMDAVTEMIEYIKANKQWETLEIVFGYYPLQRMVWIICTIFGYPVTGFDPRVEDEVVRRWLEKIRKRQLYPPEYPISI
jgi:hypothetical protein